MPSYRSGYDDFHRKPKMEYESDYEPDTDAEDDDMMEERKPEKRSCICKVECPFKIIVKVVPVCEHKRPKLG